MDATNIQTLFCVRNRRFVIPEYQRAYSWEERQLRQFIEDLQEAGDKYYLGHFLFEKSGQTLYLIDGQQRLTTCVIFFSSLAAILETRRDTTLDVNIIRDYYLKDSYLGTQKLTTVCYDNPFFHDIIIDRSRDATKDELTSSSKKAIWFARQFFDAEMAKTDTTELERWASLIEQASITEFVVNSKVEAAQIFAFQNDRGKALTRLEVLKSYFMLQIYLSPDETEKQEEDIRYIEQEFIDIYKTIVCIHNSEDSVLNYYWRGRSKYGYGSENTVAEVKECLRTKQASERIQWIRQFVSELKQAFLFTKEIENDSHFDMQNLSYIGQTSLWMPILIKAKRVVRSTETYYRIVRLMENLTFRSRLRGGRADIASRLNDFLRKMTNDNAEGWIDNIIRDVKAGGWWGYWSDSQLRSNLNWEYFYHHSLKNYLLWRYEQYLCSRNYPKPKVSFDEIRGESIEHIAPQTCPDTEHPEYFGYGIYEDKENPEEGIVSGEWLHAVGNLVLMAQGANSSVRNGSFLNKLSAYESADNLLHQQKEIRRFVSDTEKPVWDKAAIERRQQAIVDAAMQIWNLDNI